MLKWLILILFHGTGQEYIYSTRPLPKAEILDEVLSKLVNRSDYTGSLFSFLSGNEDFGDPDNLDVCMLDANNVFKIISKAKKLYEPYFRRTKSEALEKDPKLSARALDLMRQSIYATRYRMQDTKRFRKAFTDDARFHIAVLYGALIQVTHKMEALYAVMRKLPKYTFLIWYVIIYEKILAAHVDVHNLVDRIIDLHNKYLLIKAKKAVRFVPKYPKMTGTRASLSRATPRLMTTLDESYEDENSTLLNRTRKTTIIQTIKRNITTTISRWDEAELNRTAELFIQQQKEIEAQKHKHDSKTNGTIHSDAETNRTEKIQPEDKIEPGEEGSGVTGPEEKGPDDKGPDEKEPEKGEP